MSIEGEEARLEARDRGLTVDELVNHFAMGFRFQREFFIPSGFFLGLAVLAISTGCLLSPKKGRCVVEAGEIVDCEYFLVQ